MIAIAIQQSAHWAGTVDWEDLALRAVTHAIRQTPHGDLAKEALTLEISVKLTDDAEVRTLNAAYRDKDKPTNVLSFPMVQPDMLSALANSDDGEVLLGDIVLAHGVCLAEAEAKQIPIDQHATHLVVHGTLHLLGYDHETGEAEAEAMEAMERSALAALGIADPYQPVVNMDEV
ncbi:rRNA maturation RNase YbeY [Parasphingopyxis algicola]|uniref:rRNA maturation RNase YbeY n=1 Tax=Parasphingopyxis algicola TaxID=2026624 RepID=UPI0015A3201B|nr:rRNA maturation RNase YbeY [Parasphingopyxis algicola]QLC25168.1 rRNA maturation RNase YbeY [Parasphingopyxis algicola]